MKKILRINLADRTYRYEDTPDEYRNLGGRGLTSKIVSTEVPPTADPLGQKNLLVFAPGILAGTMVPNSGRLSIGAKSPLTNTIKESNAGGSAAQKLARLGIQAIVLEGKALELTVIKIDINGITFISGNPYGEMGNYSFIDQARNEFGAHSGIISIGPAGEHKYRSASISVTTPDFHIRTAARGGLGAVMGNKGVKALILDDTGAQERHVADRDALKGSSTELTKGILSHPLVEGLKLLGTPLLVSLINSLGALPTRNYSMGTFDKSDRISGEYLADIISKRPGGQPSHRCMNGCVIQCSNIYTDTDGTPIVSGLEYETIAMIGANCSIGDLNEITEINRACNDIGVDTIEFGASLALMMEAGLVTWGDGKAALSLVEEIRSKTQTGIMLGQGCRFTGVKLGSKRIPHVKGQSLAGYDPRVLKGTGVTYATSPMGADHTAGNALPSPAHPEYNPSHPKGQGPFSGMLQRYVAAIDTLGICLFASLPLLDQVELQKYLIDCISAVTGQQYPEDYLISLGTTVLRTEKAFNEAVGFTKKDDRLPDFFMKEKLPGSGLVFDVSEREIDGVLRFKKGM